MPKRFHPLHRGVTVHGVIATLLLLAGGAGGEIYRWTDASGRLHFTQRLDQVPAAQRAAARRDATQEAVAKHAPSESAAPPVRRARGAHELEIPFERMGNVMKVDVRLNDALVAPFLIDTGASGVSLPARFAQQLGIRIGPDNPTLMMQTANGRVARPVITLDSIELGGARVENLRATVNPTMEIGLLGGTFFNNFVYQVDAAQSVIRLQPNERVRGGMSAQEWSQRFEALRAPLARVEAYLASEEVRERDRARLERHRSKLSRALRDLDDEANRKAVPQRWRSP